MGSTDTISFNGSSYNTGNITAGSLTRTGIELTNRGYNLIGNPYPNTVSWDAAARTNLETSMYYRTNNGSTMLFDTYNATGSVGTSNNGSAVTGDIPPTQAFWVRVPADEQTGSITFDNADRSHGTQARIYKVAAEEGTLRIKLSDGNVSDEQIISFNPSAESSYEDYDSQKFRSSNVPQLYSNLAADTLTINGLNNPIETPVYLEDRMLNMYQTLNANPVYASVKYNQYNLTYCTIKCSKTKMM